VGEQSQRLDELTLYTILYTPTEYCADLAAPDKSKETQLSLTNRATHFCTVFANAMTWLT